MAMRRRHRIDPRRIESVTVFTHRHGKTNPGCDHPGPFAEIGQAQMSNQFGVALALSGRRPDLAGFGDYADPELTELVSRVAVVEDPAFTQRYPGRSSARIEVTLVDGSAVAERLDDATSLSDAEVAAGFREALAARFKPSMAADLLRGITRVETVRSVADLFAGFRQAATALNEDDALDHEA